MLAAAAFADALGTPLNRLVTINIDALTLCGAEGVFAGRHPADGVKAALWRCWRWFEGRGRPWVAVWVRERAGHGEHVHIALHVPHGDDEAFLAFLARLTGEAGDGKRRGLGKLVGRSELRNWDVRRDVRGIPGNPALIAYLAKAEPNTIRRRGKTQPNPRKVRKLHRRGGRIEGTAAQSYRWGLSRRTIGPLARKRAGWSPE